MEKYIFEYKQNPSFTFQIEKPEGYDFQRISEASLRFLPQSDDLDEYPPSIDYVPRSRFDELGNEIHPWEHTKALPERFSSIVVNGKGVSCHGVFVSGFERHALVFEKEDKEAYILFPFVYKRIIDGERTALGLQLVNQAFESFEFN